MIRGVAWNFLGMVAIALTMLISVPLFLRYFGAERYGILATVWVLFGYFSVLDFGMGPAVVSFLSRRDRQSVEQASEIFWTAFIMNFVMGIVLAAVLNLTIYGIIYFRLFPRGAIWRELFDALPLLFIMMPVSLLYPILVGALDARRLFGLANANQVFATILAQALPLIALIAVKPTLTVALAGSVMGRALSAMILLYLCIRKLHLVRLRFERRLVGELMSFGGWVALSSGVGLVLDTADRLVITWLLGGVPAAWYAISYNVVTRVRALPSSISRALFPQVASDRQGGTITLLRSTRVLVLILIPVLTAGMVLIDPLCRLWIGDVAADGVVPVARIMMLGVYANSIGYIPFIALQAGGEPGRLAKIHLWEVPVFLVVMYVSTLYFGIIGAALSWSARLFADTIILLWITDLKRILFQDLVLQTLVPVTSLAIALLLPGNWVVEAAASMALLAGWALVDTLIASRDPASVSLLTLWRQGIARANVWHAGAVS